MDNEIRVEALGNTSPGGIHIESTGRAKEIKTGAPVEVRGVKVGMSGEMAIRFGVVGAGQGGSRIAEVFGALGYPSCAINTAKQDLKYIKLPEDRKLCMEWGLGGAGKDIRLGEEAFAAYQNSVKALIERTFSDNVDYALVCVGGGGGTGSGAAEQLIHTLHAYNLPVGMIYTLPQSHEDALTHSNAVKVLDKLGKLVKEKILTTLIVVDNAKIETIYPSLSTVAFWQKANGDLVNILHQFNRLSAQPSRFISFDGMDFAKVITEGGCTIYGAARLSEYKDAESLAATVVGSVKAGLLASEFNLAEATMGGIVVTGAFDTLSTVPQEDINYAIYNLTSIIGHAGIYRGIYDLDASEAGRGLVVYTILSGLGVPHKRVEALIQRGNEGAQALEIKKNDLTKMNVIGSDSSSVDQDKLKSMKDRHSPLGKLLNHIKKP